METLDELLKEEVAMHGHLCPGQVLGVRMAMVGCREVGILEPGQSRALIVWVEIDRCATDAIQGVTGCKLGKRTLKYVDYGKMAATLLNTETGKAVRVVARDDSREKAGRYVPPNTPAREAQLRGLPCDARGRAVCDSAGSDRSGPKGPAWPSPEPDCLPIFDDISIVARDVEPFAYLGLPVIQDAGPRQDLHQRA